MKNSGQMLLVLALVAGLALAMSSGAPAKKPAKPVPEVRPDGESVDVEGPEPGEKVQVTLPSTQQLTQIFDDALEAAELADASTRPQAQAPVRPQAQAPVRPPVLTVVAQPAQSKPQVNDVKARLLAPGVAKNIRTKKYDYSRQSLRDFQTAAGLKPDGIYGPASAEALARYTPAPKPLFKRAS